MSHVCIWLSGVGRFVVWLLVVVNEVVCRLFGQIWVCACLLNTVSVIKADILDCFLVSATFVCLGHVQKGMYVAAADTASSALPALFALGCTATSCNFSTCSSVAASAHPEYVVDG